MAGSSAELIKEKLDIVEFLKGYLKLQPAGKNFKALCPFHKEKTPSFMISPDRQSWHCFGCGVGGDSFAFLMRYENLDFGEALKILAERAGVELKNLQSGDYKYSGLLYELNERAKDFFVKELKNSEAASDYLNKRSLKKETIEEFEIGWAPNDAEALGLHLLNLGYSPEDISRAGLAFKTERGLQVDRFRGRVMFPIHNNLGKVVGFTGRVLPQFDTGNTGKYVNSPETPIFNKSKLLYGFWKSKNFIRDAGSAFLVEGQMDFLASWQAGVKNTVASSGTALTVDHLKGLKRFTEELIISFDSDSAGMAAGERAIDIAEANDFNVKVVMLKGFKDPAEAAEKNPEILKKSVAEAKPAMEFYFEKYLPVRPPVGSISREYLKSLRAVLGKIKSIVSPVTRNFWVKDLSRRVNIDENVLIEEFEKIQASLPETEYKIPDEDGIKRFDFSRRDLVSQRLLALCSGAGDMSIAKDIYEYLPQDYQKIFSFWENNKKSIIDERLGELMGLIEFQYEFAKADNIQELKKFLVEEHAKEKLKKLIAGIKAAEIKGDAASTNTILRELDSHINNSYEEKK